MLRIGIDTDPDWPDPDRHALDADPDADLVNDVRIRPHPDPQHWIIGG